MLDCPFASTVEPADWGGGVLKFAPDICQQVITMHTYQNMGKAMEELRLKGVTLS